VDLTALFRPVRAVELAFEDADPSVPFVLGL